MQPKPPPLSYRSWMQWLPKLGEKDEDCQDFADRSENNRRFVLCDGVSNSSLPAIWARLVAQHFCQNPQLALAPDLLADALATPRKEWNSVSQSKAKTAWWLAGSRAIAAATFLSVDLQTDLDLPSGLAWVFRAVGDTCAFLWRQTPEGQALHKAFPFEQPDAFHLSPSCLFSSEEAQNKRPLGLLEHSEDAREGDILLLATDAFSKWLLTHPPAKAALTCKSWVQDRSTFREYVDRERDSGRMEDDDITLVVVELTRASAPLAFQRRDSAWPVASPPTINRPPVSPPSLSLAPLLPLKAEPSPPKSLPPFAPLGPRPSEPSNPPALEPAPSPPKTLPEDPKRMGMIGEKSAFWLGFALGLLLGALLGHERK